MLSAAVEGHLRVLRDAVLRGSVHAMRAVLDDAVCGVLPGAGGV